MINITKGNNLILMWTGIALVLLPTLYVFVIGVYFYPLILDGFIYKQFWENPTYSFIPDNAIKSVFFVINIVFFGTLIGTWLLVFNGVLRRKYIVLFIISSLTPLVMMFANGMAGPEGRMYSKSGNTKMRYIKNKNEISIISTYKNAKEPKVYDPKERPKWILVRKDTIPR